MARVKIVETILRDAHQSLAATRMSTADMEGALEYLDASGYYSLEMWGGATFDSCLRYLNEDPWKRLSFLRSKIKNTKLQMLLRGKNLLGYKHYPDEVVREFIKKSVAYGIDIFRIFDALNDIDNIASSIEVAKGEGAHVQAAISYTVSPVHSREYFVNLAKSYQDLGVDSICIKDMSGILLPYEGEKLVKELKKVIEVPIDFHSHMSCGMAEMTAITTIEAGVDIVDTALSPFAGGTSQPATEVIATALEGTPYDTGLHMDAVMKAADHFQKIYNDYTQKGMIPLSVTKTNMKALRYQVPGGMLSNMIKQLQDLGQIHLFDQVMEEIPLVRKDMGYPPLVTPMSQMVGTQALFNVMTGRRYQMVPKEIKAYLVGEYGKAPSSISQELMKLLNGYEKQAPDENLLAEARRAVAPYSTREEDALSYALFPDITLEYLKKSKL